MARKRSMIVDSLGRERAASRASWGKVRTLSSGRLQASYVGPDSKRHYAPQTFTTRVDAETWLAGERTAIARDEWEPPTQIRERARTAAVEEAQTLGDYAQTWLRINRTRKGVPLRPRTVEEYQRLLSGPLADLTRKSLVSITATQVDVWFAEQSETGKLTQTSRAYSLLKTIMGYALDRGRILTNPCRVVGGQVARTGRKVMPPTDDELAIILKTIDPRFVALVHLAAEGGLRYGEATDLHRSDVEIERDADGSVSRVLVHVTHAVTRTAQGFASGPPKSEAGIRSVYIYGRAAEAIAEHLATHVGKFGDPLLFPAIGDKSGTKHLAQSTFHTPWWNSARLAAGRPDMPFHALRHRAGTVYVQHGATMAEAMARLGHSSTQVAMRYQHATGRDAEIAARMAGTAKSAPVPLERKAQS